MSNCNDPLCMDGDCLSCLFPEPPRMRTLEEIRNLPIDDEDIDDEWDITDYYDQGSPFDDIDDNCLTDNEYEAKHGVSR